MQYYQNLFENPMNHKKMFSERCFAETFLGVYVGDYLLYLHTLVFSSFVIVQYP